MSKVYFCPLPEDSNAPETVAAFAAALLEHLVAAENLTLSEEIPLKVHFGEKGSCFYGGVMQDKVYSAVRSCNGIVMLCPNYNDAISANLTAFINRLTALFRQVRFYDKALFSLIVSGYSGGDIVARQLISALNMNKSFYLPPNFALIETANDPGEAIKLDNINQRLDIFAKNICDTLIK